jgi:hypothetical protein
MKVNPEKRKLRKKAIKHQNRTDKKITFSEALKHVQNVLSTEGK